MDFEKALERSSGAKECWAKVLAGSREFKFQGVRLCVDGQIFENFGSYDAGRLWEMRIPLPEDQYVGFFRDFETESSPLVLSAFVNTVEREIVVRRRPVQVYRTRAATAAAGKG